MNKQTEEQAELQKEIESILMHCVEQSVVGDPERELTNAAEMMFDLLAKQKEEWEKEARIDELGMLMSSKVLEHAWVPELDAYYNQRIAHLSSKGEKE